MAAKRDDSLQPEIGRHLCRVRIEGGKYRGYKKDILTENLSERDNAIFVCPRCKGILRELRISTSGDQFCFCCKKEGEQTNPNVHMNNMILSFKCCCPLIVRGCGWLGTLKDCENHLDTCGYVQEKCKLKCGVVSQRNNHVTHDKENCIRRIVKCEHCKENFKFCELTKHLDVCPKMKVSCKLKCGVVMCRDKVTQHLEKECDQVEENCKLGCGLKLTRNELTIHVTDECVQRLVACEHCEENFKFRELTKHLDVCPKMKMSCKLKCGVVMCRDKVTQHLEKECDQVEENCKLGCGMKLTRNELTIHVTDECVQRLIACEHCKDNFIYHDMSKHLDVCPKMKVSCKLKCGVVMCRDKVTQHLEKECGQVEENCKLGCGLKLTRNEITIHVTDECVQRLVGCEHCKENFKICELTEHLDVCPKMKVPCELKCGVVMCRDKVTQHIDSDCKEKEIECPFVKYKCVGLIKRQNLATHLEENETEHLKMKLNAIEDIVMKMSEMIEKQNETIEGMSRNILSLEMRKNKQKLSNPIKFRWEIPAVRRFPSRFSHEREFDANGYLIRFNLSHRYDSLLMDFCLKDGLDYDRLDWPFRAKFVVHSITPSHSVELPRKSENIKSDVIEVERKDLASNFRIATIPCHYPTSIVQPLYAELEIYIDFVN